MTNTAAPATPQDLRSREVEEFIYSANMRLDAKDFKGWLDLCSSAFAYTIRTFSPEIRKDVVWLDHDFEGMATLVSISRGTTRISRRLRVIPPFTP